MNFEEFNESKENAEISDDVKTQLENLGLETDEIKGKILDVGSGEGIFAKELKSVSDADIISLDNYETKDVPEGAVTADVKNLPFKEDSFDKVISHASIPNVFIGMYNEEFSELSKEEIKNSISKSLKEILRVLKHGSNAIMAPVRIADNYNSEKVLANSLEEVIDEIKDEADVSFELIREVENPENKEVHKEYRLTLSKK